MSVLSEKIRVALFNKMNVPSVTSLASGGIHHIHAPENASKPFVIFQRQASGDVIRSFSNSLLAEDDLWLVKAISDEDSSTTKEPQQLNAEILAACENAIGSSLAITGGTVYDASRLRDIPEYYEIAADRSIYHSGFILRIVSA